MRNGQFLNSPDREPTRSDGLKLRLKKVKALGLSWEDDFPFPQTRRTWKEHNAVGDIRSKVLL